MADESSSEKALSDTATTVATNEEESSRGHIDVSALQIHYNPARSSLPPLNTLRFGHTFTDHMLTIDYDAEQGWHAPVISPFGSLTIHPASTVLHYAVECFEGAKVFKNKDGVISEFRLKDNLRRFAKSIKRSGVAEMDEADENALYELIRELVLLDSNLVPDEYGYSLYLRPTFIGTEPSLEVAAGSKGKLFVICSPVGPFFPCGFKPVSLLACTRNVRAWPGGSGGHKVGSNYGPTLMPAKMASEEGFTQILWLLPLRNEDGELKHHITEVGSMNVFFVFKRDDNGGGIEVATPPTKDIILPGITRDSVLKILRNDTNLEVSERDVTMEELLERYQRGEVMEIFGTGTAAIVCPVKSVTYEDVEMKIPIDEAIGAGPMCRRILDEAAGQSRADRPEGIKKVEHVIQMVPKRAEKVHIRQNECLTEFDDLPHGRKIVVDEGRHAPWPRAFRPAKEMSLEETIGGRRRVATVKERRNGLPVVAEGDKLYKHPE
ncbi:branched-chain-amino-acid aminotransferase [Perkinsus chesapeaki]|uniref:Branched-chain-amino-acid aminotransferase n=1 Tax=Perkinsus chesapeaki TaxID=330153 RepID=A0A7J6LT66_PERCH|nr:branched-chain-amino-acid aminotransferase [Perkinsus chesapeaki]